MSRKKASYHCTYEDCTASFNRPGRLEIHLRSHTGKCPFVCEYDGCNKSYKSSSHLKRHEATHESPLNCTVEGCFEILKTKVTLKKHIDNFHHKKKQKLYKCTECDKDFSKHNWLQSHMYKHTGTFPYKCKIEDCGKGFLFSSKLKRHMKVHEGHLCKIPGCEKVFLKWSLYVAHLKESHRSRKVHKCDICEREFFSSSNLKVHRAVHEDSLSRKVYPCEMPNCTRFYFEEKNLNFHVKTYHDTRPYVCDREHCHRAFKTKGELDCHILHHIRRKPRKKKKPKPSFAAILSGCADPRKFTRRMPPKRITPESSDEFTTDDEVVYEDMSSEEIAHKSSHSEMADSDGHLEENQAGPSKSIDDQFSQIPPRKRVRSESTDVDSSSEETPSRNSQLEDSAKDHSANLLESQELDLSQKSIRKPPTKCMRLEKSDKEKSMELGDLHSNSLSALDDSIKSHDASKTTDDGMSSSEYESLTVTVFGDVGDKHYSESDEVSSCLSEAEDLLNYNDMCSRRER